MIDSCEAIADDAVLTEREALFFQLVFDQEFGGDIPQLRKWNGNITIFVEGTPTQELLNELTAIVAELNSLGTFIEITIVIICYSIWYISFRNSFNIVSCYIEWFY